MKLVFYLSTILILLSCTDSRNTSARMEEMKSGVIVDTVVCGICFNDNPDTVQKKIDEWASSYPDFKFRMHFSYPERLNKYTWKIGNQWYYNDSLRSISIRSNIYSYLFDECMGDLNSLFSHKYGKSFILKNGEEIEWYKGNLTINISTHKDLEYVEDYISITYSDGRYYEKRNGKTILKHSDDYKIYYEYSQDYWDNTYKQKEEDRLNEATKNI